MQREATRIKTRTGLVMPKSLSLCVFLVLCTPALAQVDLQGSWRPLPRVQDGGGVDGDIDGIPVNEGDRLRGQSWSPEGLGIDETGCSPHAWDYSLAAPLSP